MKNILIEIETRDKRFASQLLETPKKFDRKADLPANVTLMKVQMNEEREGTLLFLLSFGDRVDTGLVANWLWEKIKVPATKLCMDRIEVQINKSAIEGTLANKAEKEELG
jgi:hypothetical protein